MHEITLIFSDTINILPISNKFIKTHLFKCYPNFCPYLCVCILQYIFCMIISHPMMKLQDHFKLFCILKSKCCLLSNPDSNAIYLYRSFSFPSTACSFPPSCFLLLYQDNEISPEGLLSLLSSELKRELPEEFVYRRALSEWQQTSGISFTTSWITNDWFLSPCWLHICFNKHIFVLCQIDMVAHI